MTTALFGRTQPESRETHTHHQQQTLPVLQESDNRDTNAAEGKNRTMSNKENSTEILWTHLSPYFPVCF